MIRVGGDLSFFAASGHLPPLVDEEGSSLGHLLNRCAEGIKMVLGFGVSSSSLPRPHLGRGIRELVLDLDSTDQCGGCCSSWRPPLLR